MITFLQVIYVIVCLFLILVVLLQSGRGGGLGSSFGGGGAGQQIFGGAGAGNLLTRLTSVFAFTFMLLSAVLAYLSTSGEQALDRAVRDAGAPAVTEELEALVETETDSENEASAEDAEPDALVEQAAGEPAFEEEEEEEATAEAALVADEAATEDVAGQGPAAPAEGNDSANAEPAADDAAPTQIE